MMHFVIIMNECIKMYDFIPLANVTFMQKIMGYRFQLFLMFSTPYRAIRDVRSILLHDLINILSGKFPLLV